MKELRKRALVKKLPLALLISVMISRLCPAAEAKDLVTIAQRLLDSPKKREWSQPFDESERRKWDWTPGKRFGLVWKQMTPDQKALTDQLLQGLLSPDGFIKVKKIIAREKTLAELEKNPDYRDPDLYYLALFGAPALPSRWGVRFEGHHISLNFVLEGNRVLSATPMVLGANPRVLKGSPDPIFEKEFGLLTLLRASFENSQWIKMQGSGLQTTLFPADLWGGGLKTAREQLMPTEVLGQICSPLLKGPQIEKLALLLAEWVKNAQTEFAERALKALQEEKEHFCVRWLGKDTLSDSHHMLLHGDHYTLEINAVQDRGNHYHTVWRDFSDAFLAKTPH